MAKIILDFCGGTGSWSLPYKKATDKNGQPRYGVIVPTLPEYNILEAYHIRRNGISYIVFPRIRHRQTWVVASEVYGILAAPVCTYFSRARTRAKTSRDLKEGMKLVRACVDIIWIVQEVAFDARGLPLLKFWALENPMGSLRRFLGRPRFSFNPCDYGDAWTKKTDIWGWFNEPKKNPIKLDKIQSGLCKNNNRKLPSISDFTSSTNTVRRAITPPGFAQAFFKANR